MTGMSKISGLLFAVSLFLFAACQEEKPADSIELDIIAVVKVHESPLREKIDWSWELGFLESEEVLEKAASVVGIDAGTLDQATRIEVDIEARTIHIIARHEDGDTAQSYADSLANASIEARIAAEKILAGEQLAQLDRELEAQKNDVVRRSEVLSKLLEEQVTPSAAEDSNEFTLSYQKAKEALEEDPLKEAEELGDGVLFQKKNTK